MDNHREENNTPRHLCAGLLAHVDAGKTTLSEAFLYRGGLLRSLGRVDKGSSFLDTDEQERARGITIFSQPAVLQLGDLHLTLLDTPGHVDFSAEMERAIQALDYAILVISGVDGVQSHTETLWALLRRYQVPVFIFVNKMDLPGPGRAALMEALHKWLSPACVDVSADVPAADRAEALALSDEILMEHYLETGTVTDAQAAQAIRRRGVFPCWFGSALKLQGVDDLMDGLRRYTLCPAAGADFGATVYKISQDESGQRLTWLKITSGSLKSKTLLSARPGDKAQWSEKADQLRLYSGAKFAPIPQAVAGQVVAVTGLTQTFAGQGLGTQPDAVSPSLEPILTYRVDLPAGTDPHLALTQLRTLSQEDPQLHVLWDEGLGEIHIQLMGEVQLEILEKLIAARFGMAVGFSQGGILYKETIAAPVEGVGHYEPLRHYAEVHLLLEPGEPGSGLVFAARCREDALDRNWQRLILTHLAEKQHRGVLTGAPLTDVKITLLGGRAHAKHTEGGDFRQATYRAVRQGLRSTESVLLEPWYQFRMELPADAVGRAMTDIQRMGGKLEAPQTLGELALLTGTAPVSEMRPYQSEVVSYTRGRGRLTCTVCGYQPCHNADAVIAAAGYDPDHDVYDPCDSVFCAHGAGFTVKWDQVREYMHVDTGWGKPAPEPTAMQAPVRRSRGYSGSLEEDKELLAIFERTYGPIKRDPRKSFHKAPAPAVASRPADPVPTGPEYLLVDGYNVVHAWPELAALAEENLEMARRRLMDILCNYQGYKKCQVILVFDAYKRKNNPGQIEAYHNIHVVYTKEAETADMYIEKVTHQIGRKHRVRVVTSDGMEQLIILGQGGLRVSSRMFKEEMDEVEKAIRAYLES